MPIFKSSPEDFVVEEIPAYVPSGAGDHLYVTFQKRALTTDQTVRRMAEVLGVESRDVGVAGLKDKIALTTQTISFPIGPKRTQEDAEAALATLPSVGQSDSDFDRPEFRVLSAARHPNKLRTGHLRGNRFSLWVRGITPAEAALATERIALAERDGIPNSFGDQRFGRHGDNATRALAFLRGEQKPPRDQKQARFLFSAFQSLLFNTLLDERVADGTFAVPEEGELVMRHRDVLSQDEDERGALFLCKAEELEVTRARALAHEVSPTGPMWGAKMRQPEGAAQARELELLARFQIDEAALGRFSRLGEGVRRSLRLFPEDLRVHSEPARTADGSARVDETDMQLQFVLPKGAYATEVLAWVFPGGLTEPNRPAVSGPSPEPVASPSSAPPSSRNLP